MTPERPLAELRDLAQVPAYPPDAVLTIHQLAKALQTSVRTVERMNLPTVYLGAKTKRYIWAQIVEVLRERAQ